MKKFWLLALVASTALAAPVYAQGKNLPPTTMDSFVKQAQGNADLIYGDEGTLDVPPYDSFDPIHRINSGIYDRRNAGLTTGHGSYLPDAWGGDEFTGNEWSRSGASSNPTQTPIFMPSQPTYGDPASNMPGMNPTSVIQPITGRGDVQFGAGGPGNQGVVLTSPGANLSPRPIPFTTGGTGGR